MSSKSQKSNKKKENRVIFPHPLLKSLHPIQISNTNTPSFAPPSYLPIHHQSYSSLMLRTTHTHPVNQSKFSLILHPLIQDVHIPKYTQIEQCSHCESALTYHTITSQSLCRLCSKPVSMNHSDLINHKIFDMTEKESINLGASKKKTLFMIEANQYLYNCSVHTIIRMLLSEMRDQFKFEEPFNHDQGAIFQEYGFAFFNEANASMINFDTNQLCTFKPTQFLQDQLPVPIQSAIKPQSEIDFDVLQQISDYVMYESFKKKESCLESVLEISEKLFEEYSIQTICIAHNFPERKGQSYPKSISIYLFNTNLKEQQTPLKQNLLSKNSQKPKKLGETEQILWKYNIKKIYSHQNPDIHDFHYAIHDHLTNFSYYGVQSIIKSSSKSVIPTHPFLKIPQIHFTNQILIDFEVEIKDNSQKESFDIIYLQFRFTKEKRRWKRVIVFTIPEIIKQKNKEHTVINDENFVYASVLRSLQSMRINKMQMKGVEYILNQITADVKRLLMKLVDSKYIRNCEQCSLPNNIFHTLIYLYLLTKQSFQFFLTIEHENLQFLAKKLYPKIFQVSEQKTKPMKFIQRTFEFQQNPLLVLDDGNYISIVLSEPHSQHYHYNQFLEQYFGTHCIEQIVVMDEIPELETNLNKNLHKLIKLLREYSKFRYLPLKLVMADSEEFDQRFGRMYIQKEHFSYIHSLLKTIFCF